ncbi:hypothetical protein LS71_009290 [Helicobacter jaachi]|uniref:Terminase n=1 Tax=Helicobacter jaachi TaxID=1677920 RepID=A0A4U8T7K5_9HELI|nr:hypothetical protein [Helicobacter jaachi]TLD94637.1 hypothetical protein LS71_009290 [Helicobacter jaachi]
MAIHNKKEIEIFYKTHNLSIKEVALHFQMSYRTLAHWVKSEGWQMGSAIENVQVLKEDIVRKNITKSLQIAKDNIKDEIRHNLGECANELDSLLLDNLLASSTEELLLRVMSLEHIHKNLALLSAVAKDNLLKIARDAKNAQERAMVIACAEKVGKMYESLQSAIYGKNLTINSTNSANKRLEDLSNEELESLIRELDS